MAFPKFLQQNGYCNPIDPSKTAFHLGMHTSQTFFQWLQSHPQDSENFGIWMSAQRESRPIFLDVMDFERELGQGTNSSTGARAYYLRQVLHDWPNDKCKVILENIKAGMSQDSTLLIDEMVISERNAPWRGDSGGFHYGSGSIINAAYGN
ncbi:O-methyltransferase [Coccidioides immitis RMSCC 3703]|uniref:O-methyltransferase n=1 Tax=Coccidioides immitis RMSCC 3703 TaxID=454286 RepID=A0A0J8TWT0_COCIT|nr:O-methyltransferase [Coccidioides immitis RMSCC 3703]